MMKTISFHFILIGLVLATGCAGKQEIKSLKLGHALDQTHPVHQGMVYLGDRLSEKSGGTMQIEIYPSGQLGNERELLELLQIGSLSMTKVSAAVMENFAPNFKVLGLPYLFQDRDHVWKVLNGEIGEQLLKEGEDYRLLGLCFYDAGSRSFYTKEAPVNSPEDLKGLKIRVMRSNTAVNMIKEMGGSPTPISWGELYSALQQGVVDGAENNPPSFYLSRHYEVCKYYSLDEHTTIPDVLLISKTWWDDLDSQQKKWLKEAAMESVAYQRQLWQEAEKESLDAVRTAGVTIVRPEKSGFSARMDGVYKEYQNDVVKNALIQKIKNIGNEKED